MKRKEPDDATLHAQDGWPYVWNPHQKDLLHIATTALGKISGREFNVEIGTVKRHGIEQPIGKQMKGRRIITLNEKKPDMIITVDARHAPRIQPADYKATTVEKARKTIQPDARARGLPTQWSLKNIATTSRNAMQFVKAHGGKPEISFKKDPDQFLKIKKENAAPPTPYLPGPDGVRF